jgi:hypothetical protein
MKSNKRWKLIDKSGIGAFGYEIYEDTQSNEERFLVKVFIYDKPVLLSGNREILGSKLEELTEVFKELQEKFPPPEEPPF